MTDHAATVADIAAKQRAEMEARVGGQVWTTDELTAEFNVEGFCAGMVVVNRKSDGQRGSMMFQHMPRYYYGFEAS